MKRITVLNGITDEKYRRFEGQLDEFARNSRENMQIERFTLRNMDIGYCTGCWSCWLKTPGQCPIKDEMPKILKSIIHSDLTVFISPIVMGFVSKYIKKVCDRSIPFLLPYIGIFENEFHHFGRYDKYPAFGLMLLTGTGEGKSGMCLPEGAFAEPAGKAGGFEELPNDSVNIITDVYRRMALNLKTKLAFSIADNADMEVLANEMYRI